MKRGRRALPVARTAALFATAALASLMCFLPSEPVELESEAEISREFADDPVPAEQVALRTAAPPKRVSPPPEPAARAAKTREAEGHGEALDVPHPITAEHRVIQRELRLIAALIDALDLRDASSLRRLIALHKLEYPQDENALRAGYERIADCLETPGEHSRQAAQDYYATERASTLRRYVRRVCLEGDGAR